MDDKRLVFADGQKIDPMAAGIVFSFATFLAILPDLDKDSLKWVLSQIDEFINDEGQIDTASLPIVEATQKVITNLIQE